MNGRRALLALLQRTQGRYVAGRCRVSRTTVSRWASGSQRPSAAARAALERNYEIPASSWGVNRQPGG
jgi:transcriptional regulator with XRE-family HTH domain